MWAFVGAVAGQPKQGSICFYSDGLNVMNSAKNKVQESAPSTLVDVCNCNSHKIHNVFAGAWVHLD